MNSLSRIRKWKLEENLIDTYVGLQSPLVVGLLENVLWIPPLLNLTYAYYQVVVIQWCKSKSATEGIGLLGYKTFWFRLLSLNLSSLFQYLYIYISIISYFKKPASERRARSCTYIETSHLLPNLLSSNRRLLLQCGLTFETP